MKKTIVMVLVLTLGLNMDVAKADFVFGTPTKLGPAVNSSSADGDVCVSVDGLEMYFEGRRPDGYGGLGDLYVSTRETTSDPWSEAIILDPPISGPDWDGQPSISSDGLELYFTSDRSGNTDLWVTTRPTKDAPWEEPVNLGSTVNSSAGDFGSSISADGLSLYFGSQRSDGFGKTDLWVTTRATKDALWEEPVNLGSTVNSSIDEAMPDISADGRVLFCDFMGPPQRDGGYGGQDLWMTTRDSTSDSWQEPVNLGPVVNSSAFDFSPHISPDGSTFYFTTDRDGVNRFEVVDIWQAQLIPIVDLNDDGIIDAADMCIVVDNWGTDNQLCDVGPMPWGDGVVDVEDLKVLAEHLFEVLPSAKTVDVNEADNGGQVELELGKLLVITLESNPSTGYQWEILENNESILKQFGQSEYKPAETSEPPLVGASGWEIFRFKAVSAGQTTLELVYHRPWEDAEPLKTFSVQVTVP